LKFNIIYYFNINNFSPPPIKNKIVPGMAKLIKFSKIPLLGNVCG